MTTATTEHCEFKGCYEPAQFTLTMRVGARQPLRCCEKHCPAWAQANEPSEAGKRLGREVYEVTRIPA